MNTAVQPDSARARLARVKAGVDSTRADIIAMYANQDWLELGYDSWNALCDAEFGVRLALPQDERREAVKELRSAGLSTRAIGSALGIGNGTVRRALGSRAPNGAREGQPARPVAGLDGKVYPPHRPTPVPKPREKPADPAYLARMQREQDVRAERENLTQRHTYVARSITNLLYFTEPAVRQRFIDEWDARLCDANPEDVNIPALRQLATALDQLATEWTNAI